MSKPHIDFVPIWDALPRISLPLLKSFGQSNDLFRSVYDAHGAKHFTALSYEV